MAPRMPTRQEILEWLGHAAEQAKHAEDYHAVATDPTSLQGRAAHQVARDAAAMQLIELAGSAEGFKLGRGDPNTTLERLDHALRSFFDLRTWHTHPENGITPLQITPSRLRGMIDEMKSAMANLDPDTHRILPPGERQILRGFGAALIQIEKDRLPNPAALRPRDLHYAGYYREIQFGRLAKATKLYDNWGKAEDARKLDVNSSIFDADNMAHKFHAMRGGADKTVLPVSVVAHNHNKRVPGRTLSELIVELRFELQTAEERRIELHAATTTRAREQYREAVQGLAMSYAEITGDPKAAALIRDYLQRQQPPLERQMIDAIRAALQLAAARDNGYPALPETVRDRCLDLCFALEQQGDDCLLHILDAADRAHTGQVAARETEDPRLAATLAMMATPEEHRDEGQQNETTDLQRKLTL